MILNLNKPIGWTSFDVCKKIRSITKEKKVGHGGTLDPFAQGVLIVGTGKDTKKLNDISNMNCPVIFLAGQNDYASGIWPNNFIRKKIHSPFYKSTLDSANHLVSLAEKNNWHIIFKPHPAMSNFGIYDSLIKNNHITIIENSSIFDWFLDPNK